MTPDEIVAMAERLDLPPLVQWQIDALERFTSTTDRTFISYPRIGGRAAIQRILDEHFGPLSATEGTEP